MTFSNDISHRVSYAALTDRQVEGILTLKSFAERQGRFPSCDEFDYNSFRHSPTENALRGFHGHILFCRHGATNLSEQGIITGGGLDVPLSPNGLSETFRAAASEVGQWLRKAIGNSVIAMSPLKRARKTAHIFFPFGKKRRIPGLRERLLGIDEGKTPDKDLRPLLNETAYFPKGGENPHVYTRRVVGTLIDLMNESPDCLPIVGHSLWSGTALAALAALTGGIVKGWDGKIPTATPILIDKQTDGTWTIQQVTPENLPSLKPPKPAHRTHGL